MSMCRSRKKLREAADQLREYFAGERREFSIAYDLRGTPFQEQVWRALQNIPYGQSVSYKDIAESIGRAKAVRAVGGANNKIRYPFCFHVTGYRVLTEVWSVMLEAYQSRRSCWIWRNNKDICLQKVIC